MGNTCTCGGTTTCRSEKSVSVYHTTGADIVANGGTAIPQATIDPNNDAFKFGSLSVINDTDQDIRVDYMTEEGISGQFIVPKSIKGFTRHLVNGKSFDLSSFKLYSLNVATLATGNISLNFGA